MFGSFGSDRTAAVGMFFIQFFHAGPYEQYDLTRTTYTEQSGIHIVGARRVRKGRVVQAPNSCPIHPLKPGVSLAMARA